VVLAEPRGGVPVLAQHLGYRANVLADDARVAIESRCHLGDHAVARRMMVAPGEQRRAGWRAQRGRVKAGVAQAIPGDAVETWSRNLSAERTELPVACIVDEDEDDMVRPSAGGPAEGTAVVHYP
jgi:hypothetical protein